jgi:hypothetical protein
MGSDPLPLQWEGTQRPAVRSHTSGLKQKQIPWPLVRERTIPTELPPLVEEI